MTSPGAAYRADRDNWVKDAGPMIIEIHRPELEALIMQRMKCGGFLNIEDVSFARIEGISAGRGGLPGKTDGSRSNRALRASPYRELDLEPPKLRLTTVRDVVL